MGCFNSKTGIDSFPKEALERHNYLRKLHGCPPLKLSKELNKSAQAWANDIAKKGAMSHSNTKGIGENVGYKMNSAGVDASGKVATDLWYSEIKDMKFGEDSQLQSGHFSQVIWKNTTEAGFGVAVVEDGKQAYFVGQYTPPGNYKNQWNDNVPPPLNGKIEVPE